MPQMRALLRSLRDKEILLTFEEVAKLNLKTDPDFAGNKLVEEAAELVNSIATEKTKAKYGLKEKREHTTEEVADVLLRLILFIIQRKIQKPVFNRIKMKLTKYKGYLKNEKYKPI